MSRSPPTLTLIGFVVFVSALSGSGPAVRGFVFIVWPLTLTSNSSHLGLTGSDLLSLLGLEPDGGDASADLGGLGAQVNVVSLLKHVVVGGAVKFHVTNLASYRQGKLNGP